MIKLKEKKSERLIFKTRDINHEIELSHKR
jgi:hypothetical protein